MYYTLQWDFFKHPARFHGYLPYPRPVEWNDGMAIPPGADTALRMELRPFDREDGDMSPRVPYLHGRTCPVMHRRFVDALLEFGVDNIQVHPIELTDPEDGRSIPDFCAVNVVGLVAAADMERSQATTQSGGPVIDVAFDTLVIDGKRAHGLPIFRLAEDPTHMWVHEALRDFLIAKGFTELLFESPERTSSI